MTIFGQCINVLNYKLPYKENRSLSGLLIVNEVFVSTLEVYKTTKIFLIYCTGLSRINTGVRLTIKETV